jgi:hypothetical protein
MFDQFKPIKVSSGLIEWLISRGVEVTPSRMPTYIKEEITEVRMTGTPARDLVRKMHARSCARG